MLILAALVVCCLWISTVPARSIAAPAISLEIVPAQVDLVPAVPATILIIVRNDSSAPARDLQLAGMSDAPVSLGLDPPPDLVLPPQSSLTWQAQITATQALATAWPLIFTLTYQWEAPEQQPVAGIATTTLDLRPAPVDAVERVATLRVERVNAIVNERRAGMVLLVIQNTTDVPVTIKHIMPVAPAFLTLSGFDTVVGQPIPPQMQLVVQMPMRVADRVQQGEHLLLFQLDLTWERNGHRQEGSLTATQIVTIGVPGVSDMLQVLGVPSFFLLPGFLMVAGFVALWIYAWPRGKRPLEIKSPEYWLVAILLSLVATALYPLVTGGRDYLENYGLRDIFSVWIIALVLALLAWMVVSVGMRRWLIPTTYDQPDDILRKLAARSRLRPVLHQAVTYPPRQVQVTQGHQQNQAFQIALDDLDPIGCWVVPVIRLHWTEAAMAAEPALRSQIKDALSQAEETGNPQEVRQVLHKHRRYVRTEWGTHGAITRPTRVAAEVVTPHTGALRRFIEEATG